MRVVVATTKPEPKDRLRQLALNAGLECTAADCVSGEDLPLRLSQVAAGLVLVDAGDRDNAIKAARYAATSTSVPVVAIGPTGDATLIEELRRAGARDYLDASDDLRDRFLHALERLESVGTVKARRGQTIAVVGATPGGGVTTIATNLAFALGASHPGQVLLTELSSDAPELTLDLDLQPANTLADLLRDWDRFDQTMVRQTAVAHPAGVCVMGYQPETLVPSGVEPQMMRQLVVLLRGMFDFSVLDLGHSLTPSAMEAIKIAESVVVVVRLDVPSLRLTRRLLATLRDAGVSDARIRPVANRYGQKRQVAWKQAEDALGMAFANWIPDDPGTVNHALNYGQPLVQVSRRAGITRRFGMLAQQLNGRTK